MRYLLMVLFFSCINPNVNYNTDKGGQKSYTIEKWHVKFSVSDKLKVPPNGITDNLRNWGVNIDLIDLESYYSPGDSLTPLKDDVAFMEGNLYSTDGSETMSEFESIYKIDSFKNNKGIEIFKMYVTVVNENYQDTIIGWVKTSRHVEGPIYYIGVPPKHYKELRYGRAFTFTGDSITIADIVDDFEIE